MFRLPTIVSLLALAAAKVAQASPCVAFDANFNLLVFGLDGKDWNAGTQDSWASGTATDITTSGRPSFDAPNTTCYLAQYYNAVYVMNGDSSDTSAVYIYDAAKKSWSKQSVTAGKFDPSNFAAILDHDTNVFYAISGSDLFFLNMGAETSANSTALAWTDVEQTPFGSSYKPVMALAQNHVHFLDVPNVPAGEAKIFVIHYSYFQPDAQSYPASSGNSFPAAHGKTASFFQSEGVQQEFAFIPDDGSATYVINVENNSTTSYAGPESKDADAVYAASITALVQLDSKGSVYYFPYQEGDASANANAKWTQVSAVSKVAPPGSSTSGSSSATGTKSGSASPTGSGSGSSGAASPTGSDTSGNTSGASATLVNRGFAAAGVLSILGYLL